MSSPSSSYLCSVSSEFTSILDFFAAPWIICCAKSRSFLMTIYWLLKLKGSTELLTSLTLLQQLPAWKWRPARYITWWLLRQEHSRAVCKPASASVSCWLSAWITSVGTRLLDQIKWMQKHGEIINNTYMAHKNSGSKKLPLHFPHILYLLVDTLRCWGRTRERKAGTLTKFKSLCLLQLARRNHSIPQLNLFAGTIFNLGCEC